MDIIDFFINKNYKITLWAKNNIKWIPKSEYQRNFLEHYCYDTYISDNERQKGKTEALIIKSIYEVYNNNNLNILFACKSFNNIKNIITKTKNFINNSNSIKDFVYQTNPFSLSFNNGSKIIYKSCLEKNFSHGYKVDSLLLDEH